MKWISNEPKKVTDFNVICNIGEKPSEARARHLKWRSQFIVGRPKATDT
jgi:hypothetical protein